MMRRVRLIVQRDYILLVQVVFFGKGAQEQLARRHRVKEMVHVTGGVFAFPGTIRTGFIVQAAFD